MKLSAIVNPGLEELAKQELKEVLSLSGKVHPQVLEFEAAVEQSLTLLLHGQSLRRIIISLGKYKDLDLADFKSINWNNFISSSCSSFKVEVENVKGIENRLALAKKVAGKIFAAVEIQKLPLAIELKKPDFLLLVYFNGEEYFVGIDLAGKELHSRDYRVFTHSASCKGDLGYYFVRKTGYNSHSKLLVGFVKDGVVAVEASLYANRMAVHSVRNNFSYQKLPLFQGIQSQPLAQPTSVSIAAVDERTQNITAARKNAQIAGVRNLINLQKITLDELSGAFHEQEFDQILFQVTTKDEEKLNEIYHQTKYLLKPKGTLLLIGRESWEISTPSYCKLVSEEVLERGENKYKLWLMQRK